MIAIVNKSKLSLARSLAFTFITILSFCTTYAFLTPVSITKEFSFPKTSSNFTLLFLVLSLIYYNYLKNKKLKPSIALFSSLLSLSQIVGRSFNYYDNFSYIFANHYQIVSVITIFFGLASVYYVITDYSFQLFEKFIRNNSIFDIGKNWTIRADITLILLCWLPIIFVYLPGSASWDTYSMAIRWSGDAIWDTHHPVLPTVLTGMFLDLGNFLGNANIGACLLLILNFIVIFAVAFLTIKLSHNLFPKSVIPHLVALYYSLIPIFPMYVQTLYKDSLNFAFILLLTLLVIKVITTDDWILNWKNFAFFVLVNVIVALYRNTGIYLILVLGGGFVFIL